MGAGRDYGRAGNDGGKPGDDAGTGDGDLTKRQQVTLKKDQPIWAEWVAGEEDTAEDLNGYRYKLVNGVWYREEDMPVVSSAEEPDAA